MKDVGENARSAAVRRGDRDLAGAFVGDAERGNVRASG